ncbi:MAG: alkaline phosphatase family protein [Candidatus Microthrix sp.]|nr:alkaline phosphatase family protein [Candidatus Microthrix sp.]
MRDSDAGVGDVIAAIDAAGVGSTAVVVLADHGMEQSQSGVCQRLGIRVGGDRRAPTGMSAAASSTS